MKTLPSRWYIALAALAVAGAVALGALVRPFQNAAYTITPVGGDLGWGSYAFDINARGDVLGRADGLKGGRLSFIQQGKRIIWLPAHAPPLMAERLNNNDAVIGSTWERATRSRGEVLLGAGCAYRLAVGSARTAVSDINNRGEITGVTYGSGPSRPFVWKDGKAEFLAAGTGGLGETGASAINDAGVVAGQLDTGSAAFRAALWRNGRARLLPMPSGARSSGAADLSEHGQVIGWYDAHPNTRGFLVEGTRCTDLGTLGGDAIPSAVNVRGEVVGFSEMRGALHYDGGLSPAFWRGFRFDWPRHAFLWRNGRIRDLNDLIPPGSGWVLEAANAINDAGQIVGTGMYKGQKRGFLLTPIALRGGG
jgi:probable HAF family extracellular repeat protein